MNNIISSSSYKFCYIYLLCIGNKRAIDFGRSLCLFGQSIQSVLMCKGISASSACIEFSLELMPSLFAKTLEFFKPFLGDFWVSFSTFWLDQQLITPQLSGWIRRLSLKLEHWMSALFSSDSQENDHFIWNDSNGKYYLFTTLLMNRRKGQVRNTS